MKIAEGYRLFVKKLSSIYDLREAGNMAKLVFQNELALERHILPAQCNDQISDGKWEALEKILQRLLRHEPLQYVLGEAHFYGYDFIVNPSVLIPRPETEELVDWVVKDLHSLSAEYLNNKLPYILDMGTGSGCIPVSIKLTFPTCNMFALDVDPHVLEVARENAFKHRADVEFILADVLLRDSWKELEDFDIIISNPPYVLEKERHQMAPNVVDFEPARALFVADDDPLLFYKTIADLAREKLKPEGKVYFECHEITAADVVKLLDRKGFVEINLKNDLSGKPRMVRAVWQPDR